MKVDGFINEGVHTNNIIAETPGGRADRVVVVGAHLDSVYEGPGIARRIAEGLARKLRLEGMDNIAEAVGSA